MTMYANVWLCMTIHDHIWELFQKLFHTFAKFFKILKVSEQFKIFHMIQMFSNFSYFSTNHDFVYLFSNDASMHKFCACLFDDKYTQKCKFLHPWSPQSYYYQQLENLLDSSTLRMSAQNPLPIYKAEFWQIISCQPLKKLTKLNLKNW